LDLVVGQGILSRAQKTKADKGVEIKPVSSNDELDIPAFLRRK